MGASNTTASGLPLFTDTDRPTWRGDINGAMNLIEFLFGDKANVDDVYDKAAADALLDGKADVSSVYDKAAADALLDGKADVSSVYDKAAADALLANKVSKDELIVNASDHGVVGDGITDDSAALLSALNSGNIIRLPKNKTIRVTSKVVIPSNRVILVNNCSFKTTESFNDFAIQIGSRTTIVGYLKVDIFGGEGARGVEIVGVNTSIDMLDVQAGTEGSGANNGYDCGITIRDSALIRLNGFYVSNFDYPVAIRDSYQVTINSGYFRKYVRGVYCSNVNTSTFNNLYGYYPSPNAAVSPGHNGLLIDATANDKCYDLSFTNCSFKDAGEHGFRIGGAFTCKRIHFTNCAAWRVGGCGFKVLGDAINKHEEIYYDSCVVEDAAQTVNAGFMLQNVKRCKVNNPVVRKNTRAYSAYNGFDIQGAEYVTVNDPDISDTAGSAYAVISNLGNSTGVRLNGGRITIASGVGIRISYANATFRRVNVEGWPQIEVSGGAKVLAFVNQGATGAIVGAGMVTWESVSAAGDQISPETTNISPYYCDVRAPYTTGFPAFRDGSRWLDNGVKTMAGGLWT